jgi:hypothetical protein
MADDQGGSPEEVALKLFGMVVTADNRKIPGINMEGQPADRAYILSTYAECINVVRGYAPDEEGEEEE